MTTEKLAMQGLEWCRMELARRARFYGKACENSPGEGAREAFARLLEISIAYAIALGLEAEGGDGDEHMHN